MSGSGAPTIVSLGGQIDPAEIAPLPQGVHAFRWLPQLEVLRHADVAVTHGGINTIDECVLHGTPMLIYCGFETDMGGNTSRVVHHGLGIAGDRRRDRAGDIAGHLEHLLSDERFGQSVARMRRAYEAYRRERVAERVVEELAEGVHLLRRLRHGRVLEALDGDPVGLLRPRRDDDGNALLGRGRRGEDGEDERERGETGAHQ